VNTAIKYVVEFNFEGHAYQSPVLLDGCTDETRRGQHRDSQRMCDYIAGLLTTDGFEIRGCGWSNGGLRVNIVLADGTDLAEKLITEEYVERARVATVDATRRTESVGGRVVVSASRAGDER
jgi:hypothetical protein